VLTCTYLVPLAAGDTSPNLQVSLAALGPPRNVEFDASLTGDEPNQDAANSKAVVDTAVVIMHNTPGISLAVDHNTATSSALSRALGVGTYSVTAPPLHGILKLRANGSYTYTPDSGYIGDDSFGYQAHRGARSPAPDKVSITVFEHTPIAEGTSFRTPHDTTHMGKLEASDADTGDKLVFSQMTAPGHGTLTLNADGSYRYRAVHGYAGVDSFTFQVSDGSESATATVNVVVN
jgi:VCBS repeat-containing protein